MSVFLGCLLNFNYGGLPRARTLDRPVMSRLLSPTELVAQINDISVFKDQSGCQGRFRPFAQGFKDPRATITPLGNKLVARLVPSRQCLFHSHGAVSPTNVCVLFPHRQPHLSGGHRSFPVVRKDLTMKTIVVIGSTTNPIP